MNRVFKLNSDICYNLRQIYRFTNCYRCRLTRWWTGNLFRLKVEEKWKIKTCFQRWIVDTVRSKKFLTLLYFFWGKCLNLLLLLSYIFLFIFDRSKGYRNSKDDISHIAMLRQVSIIEIKYKEAKERSEKLKKLGRC